MKLLLQCFSLFQLEGLHRCVCSCTTTFPKVPSGNLVPRCNVLHPVTGLTFDVSVSISWAKERSESGQKWGSSCNNNSKGKEFALGEKDLNNLLKKAANT